MVEAQGSTWTWERKPTTLRPDRLFDRFRKSLSHRVLERVACFADGAEPHGSGGARRLRWRPQPPWFRDPVRAVSRPSCQLISSAPRAARIRFVSWPARGKIRSARVRPTGSTGAARRRKAGAVRVLGGPEPIPRSSGTTDRERSHDGDTTASQDGPSPSSDRPAGDSF